LPSEFTLSNYPNPFNPSTKINYTIPSGDFVKITIYDALGKEVDVLITKYQGAGNYEISFDGDKLTSGVYIYRFISSQYNVSRKMLLIK